MQDILLKEKSRTAPSFSGSVVYFTDKMLGAELPSALGVIAPACELVQSVLTFDS
jgi:hypothetical protein